MFVALALTFWLAPGPLERSYEDGLAVLEHAVDSIGENDAPSTESVERALAEVAKAPGRLAKSANHQQLVRKARFTLVWSYLTAGDRAQATRVMDDTLRSTGTAWIGAGFTPDVRKLFDARLKALEGAGTGAIEVECEGCRVFVNEQEIAGLKRSHRAESLFLGEYRVFVSFDAEEPQTRTVVLDSPGTTEIWDLLIEAEQTTPPIPVPEPRAAPDVDSDLEPPTETRSVPSITTRPDSTTASPKSKKRILPLAAEISGMVIGAGLLVAGGILLGLDETCPGGGDIRDLEACPEIYHNKPQGFTLTALGAATLLTGGVLLAVDQVRVGNEKGNQAMLVWTTRF